MIKNHVLNYHGADETFRRMALLNKAEYATPEQTDRNLTSAGLAFFKRRVIGRWSRRRIVDQEELARYFVELKVVDSPAEAQRLVGELEETSVPYTAHSFFGIFQTQKYLRFRSLINAHGEKRVGVCSIPVDSDFRVLDLIG